MTRLFGTDGVRGIANADLTGELAYLIGRAVVAVLGGESTTRPLVVVGRDTRASGEFLEAAVTAGACSAGGDVVTLGVATTPGVAFTTADRRADAGVVISASHNPPEYNGIKVFGAGGVKLDDEVEDRIERLVADDGGGRPIGRGIGRVATAPDWSSPYLDHLCAAAYGSLDGMRVVVDCANGAASPVAPPLLRRLGADVLAIHDRPDGWNINEGCGATDPAVVAKAVVEAGADAGVCHDGDADRALFSDAAGNVVDGDQILAACALSMKEDGELDGNVVVTTVMANLGLRLRMREAGIRLVETKVGDRYVLEEMRRSGASLGGEQSGHIIFLRDATTGDGLLTAVRFLTLARRRGHPVSELAASVERYPQVLLNVKVRDRAAGDAPAVREAIAAAEAALAEHGRVLVRPSGTEPLIRVMVEARAEDEAGAHARSIAAAVEAADTGAGAS